jgi:hypothetical protein
LFAPENLGLDAGHTFAGYLADFFVAEAIQVQKQIEKFSAANLFDGVLQFITHYNLSFQIFARAV